MCCDVLSRFRSDLGAVMRVWILLSPSAEALVLWGEQLMVMFQMSVRAPSHGTEMLNPSGCKFPEHLQASAQRTSCSAVLCISRPAERSTVNVGQNRQGRYTGLCLVINTYYTLKSQPLLECMFCLYLAVLGIEPRPLQLVGIESQVQVTPGPGLQMQKALSHRYLCQRHPLSSYCMLS